MRSARQATTQAIRRRLCARLDFRDGPGAAAAAAAAASSRMEGIRECHVNARHPSRRKPAQPDQRRGDHRRAPSSSECDEARRGGRRTPRAPSPLRGLTSSSSPAAASTAAAFTSANPASTTSPSPHARAAFHTFLHSRNAPYVQPGDAAASPAEGISERATAVRALVSSEALAITAAAAAAPPSLSVSPPLTGSASVSRLGKEVHAAPSSSPQHSRTDASAMKIRGGGQCAAATPVLQEWSLAPPDAVGWEGAQGQSQTREGGARRDKHPVVRARDGHTPGTTHGGDTPTTHRGGPLESTRDTAGHATHRGDEGEALPQYARQPPPDEIPNQLRQHRRHAVALARRELAARVGGRHRDTYMKAAVHAYRILLQVEQRLVRWAVARQRGSHARTGATASSRHGAAEAVRADARGRVGEPRKADIDAVEAHFFEYAGQIRRTLHELTPRHFDAVHDHRLRSRTSATAEPVPQLLLLSLLWRLLHIQRLYHSIGRSAGLPRGAVGVYVQSSNCAYGMREVLRVLAAELARSTMRSSAGAAGCAGAPGSAAATPRPFSNAELFQLFYAVLCIPSEEAPGVLLLHPAAAEHAGTDGAAAARQLDAFHHDCIDTSGDVGRMPLDEWCVRWWAHQYANAAREAEQQRTDTSAASPPLPLGASLDVLRACLYSTTTSGATATFATTGGISSARGAPRGHRDGRQCAAAPTRLVTPLTFFETPPEGGGVGGRRESRDAGRRAQTAATASAATEAGPANTSGLRVLDRRFHPRLPGALGGGGGKASLRIPFHLGQRYVSSLLQYLLSRAARQAAVPDERAAVHTAASSSPSDASSASAAASSVDVAAALQRLLDSDGTRESVRDVALLCTAILFFEVYTPSTAAFMAHAAPLCRTQVELLSGHELSCVLLAYASLQRWERGGGGDAAVDGEAGYRPGTGETTNMAASRRRGPLREATVEVQSASSAATARAAAAAATAEAAPHGRRTDSQWTSANADGTARHARSATEGGTWHLFFVTLGTRAGQLSDTLSEEDVTRVLRAMKLTGLEHADLRRAMESSLRLRNLGRRVLYET